MSTEGGIRILAGLMVLVSLVLGAPQSPLFVSTLWLWLAAFTAVNLAQSGVTGFCPAEAILRRLGLRSEAEIEPSGAAAASSRPSR